MVSKMINMSDIRVLGSGLLCIDIIKKRANQEHFLLGGTAANVISILAQLGFNASFLQAEYHGKDGVWILEQIRKRRIKPIIFSRCEWDAPRIVEHLNDGKHSFITTCPNCNKKMSLLKLPQINQVQDVYNKIENLNLFYFDRISDGIKLIANMNNLGWNFYEPNSIRKYDIFLNNVRSANIVKLSEERISFKYAEKLREDLNDSNIQLLVVSLGERGLKFSYKNKCNVMSEWYHIKPDNTKKIIDSAGAGDWLTAIFIYYFLRYYPFYIKGIDKSVIEKCFKNAQQAAALACFFVGAQRIFENKRGVKEMNRMLGSAMNHLPYDEIDLGGCSFCKK